MSYIDTNLLTDFPLGFKWSGYILGIGATASLIQKARNNGKAFILWGGKVLGIACVLVYSKFVIWYSYHFQEVNIKQKCPACGVIAKHKVYFEPDLKIADVEVPGALVHECSRCECRYGQPPIVPSKLWFRVLKRTEE